MPNILLVEDDQTVAETLKRGLESEPYDGVEDYTVQLESNADRALARARAEFFDAVVTDSSGRVLEIQVKRPGATSHWIWGAFKMPGSVLHDLFGLWTERDRSDEYLGTLVNAYLARGGRASAVRAGEAYVDIGTLHGYRSAIALLDSPSHPPAAADETISLNRGARPSHRAEPAAVPAGRSG